MNMKTTLAAFAAAFETRERAAVGEQVFYCLNDDAPHWMIEVVRAAHGDMLPNDTSYAMIREAAQVLAERAADDCGPDELRDAFDEIAGGLVDVYNAELVAWLASHSERAGYVDEWLESSGGHDIDGEPVGVLRMIAAGQHLEYSRILEVIVSHAEMQA
jgi:hypothetical protein